MYSTALEGVRIFALVNRRMPLGATPCPLHRVYEPPAPATECDDTRCPKHERDSGPASGLEEDFSRHGADVHLVVEFLHRWPREVPGEAGWRGTPFHEFLGAEWRMS